MVDKLLVISLVEEQRSTGKLLGQRNNLFKNQMESIAYSFSNQDDYFLFGYSSDLGTINSLAIRTIDPVPNLLVLNSSSLKYYLFTDNTDGQLNQPNIIKFLNDILNQADSLVVCLNCLQYTIDKQYNILLASRWRHIFTSSKSFLLRHSNYNIEYVSR